MAETELYEPQRRGDAKNGGKETREILCEYSRCSWRRCVFAVHTIRKARNIMENVLEMPPALAPPREYSQTLETPAAIEIRGVRVRYSGASEDALDVEELRIARGFCTALIGSNGAGKSTLLKAIIGLLPLRRGTISLPQNGASNIASRDSSADVQSEIQKIAYVPQSREVDWSFPVSVLDVALMGRDVHLGFARRPGKADVEIARAALETLGMSEYSGRPIAALSGGQKQRVFLARALAQNAEILLLDEPFIGVDAVSETIIFAMIEQLVRDGKTVVVATHDLTTLEANYDRAILLRRRVIAAGTPAEVLQPHLLAQAYGGPLALFQERAPCHHA